MSTYTKRQNARNRARSKSTEAERYIRNARKARMQEAQAYLDAAIVANGKHTYMQPETDLANAEICIQQARELPGTD